MNSYRVIFVSGRTPDAPPVENPVVSQLVSVSASQLETLNTGPLGFPARGHGWLPSQPRIECRWNVTVERDSAWNSRTGKTW